MSFASYCMGCGRMFMDRGAGEEPDFAEMACARIAPMETSDDIRVWWRLPPDVVEIHHLDPMSTATLSVLRDLVGRSMQEAYHMGLRSRGCGVFEPDGSHMKCRACGFAVKAPFHKGSVTVSEDT